MFLQSRKLSGPQWVDSLIISRDREQGASASIKDRMTGWLQNITEMFGPEHGQDGSTECVCTCACVCESKGVKRT